LSVFLMCLVVPFHGDCLCGLNVNPIDSAIFLILPPEAYLVLLRAVRAASPHCCGRISRDIG